MFFSTLSFYDNFAENVVIFVVMSLAFFQPKYLKCVGARRVKDRKAELLSIFLFSKNGSFWLLF